LNQLQWVLVKVRHRRCMAHHGPQGHLGAHQRLSVFARLKIGH
jgi:hypothetical protein